MQANPTTPVEGRNRLHGSPPGGSDAEVDSVRPPRLDEGSKLGVGAWVTYWPESGEGSIVTGLVTGEEHSAPEALHRRIVSAEDDHPPAPAGTDDAPEQPPLDDRNDRRARGKVRRYAVTNGLTRLLTVTYKPPQPVEVIRVVRDAAQFERRLREAYPALVWVRTLERHASGALHLHYGMSEYVRKERLARLWGHGFVDVRRIRSNRPGRREAARSVARYLSKYVTKDAARGIGGHRYEVRQGYQPVAVRAAAWSVDEGWRTLVGLAGGEVPAYEWSSSGEPDWNGPPVRFLSWG